MFRKIFSMIMVAVIMTALAVPAFAETSKDTSRNEAEPIVIEVATITATLSDEPTVGMTVGEVLDSIQVNLPPHVEMDGRRAYDENNHAILNDRVLSENQYVRFIVAVWAEEGYVFDNPTSDTFPQSYYELVVWEGIVSNNTPAEPTEAPVEPTEAPVEPVEPTEAPVEPVEPTEEPVATEVPIEKVTPTPEVTEAPVEPTVVPSIDPTTPGTPATGTVALMGVGIAAIVGGGGAILFRKKNTDK